MLRWVFVAHATDWDNLDSDKIDWDAHFQFDTVMPVFKNQEGRDSEGNESGQPAYC